MPGHEDTFVLPFDPWPLVLLVADDPTHRGIVSRMLRALGYRAQPCAGSLAALHFLRDHARAVKLLLTDVALRGIDGYELAERANDLNPRLETVLMATISGPHIDELIDQIPFVAKPVRYGPLAHVLHDLIGPGGAPVPRTIPRLSARRRGSDRYHIP
jgi:CheY-like chemotaxis protein